MKFILKHLITLSFVFFACSKTKIIQHIYNYSNPKTHVNIKGVVYGLEETDHFNAIEAEAIEHELVDDTKAKVKVVGTVTSILEDNKLLVESSNKQYYIVHLEEPLATNDSLKNRKCIFQGIAQMKSMPETKRILEVETQSMLIFTFEKVNQ